jgi:hypothetical protein
MDVCARLRKAIDLAVTEAHDLVMAAEAEWSQECYQVVSDITTAEMALRNKLELTGGLKVRCFARVLQGSGLQGLSGSPLSWCAPLCVLRVCLNTRTHRLLPSLPHAAECPELGP